MEFGKFDTIAQTKKNELLVQFIKHIYDNKMDDIKDISVANISNEGVYEYIKMIKNGIKAGDKSAVAWINSMCVGCGICVKTCPVQSLKMIKNDIHIDTNKCINCGRCIRRCPFAAITDKTEIIETVKSVINEAYESVAVIAPSIVAQFKPATYKQVIAGLIALGFNKIVEAAYGADLVIEKETKELIKKGKLISSCCPSFVSFVNKKFPELTQYISKTSCPTIEAIKKVRKENVSAHIVFISPCIAKKIEFKAKSNSGYINNTITFEELNSWFEARDIKLETLQPIDINDASYYGRIFAYTNGIIEGINEKSQNKFETIGMDGIEECGKILSNEFKDHDFFGGMACLGGCINGPCVLKQSLSNKKDVVAYAKAAKNGK